VAVQGSVNKSQVGVGGIAPSTGLFTSADKFDAVIRGVGARHGLYPMLLFLPSLVTAMEFRARIPEIAKEPPLNSPQSGWV
jgi:hypothetical protein